MKIPNTIAYRLTFATLLAACATPVSAQSVQVPTTVTYPPSSIAKTGDAGVRAHTNLQILGTGAFQGAKPQVSGPPFAGYLYETPASVACIYELVPQSAGCNPNVVTVNPSGGSRAIALIDAYDDPNAFTDLETFSTQFGLPAPTSTSFQVVYAPTGGATPGSCVGPATQPPSAAPTGWDVEESLDVQYAHAMAPVATVYLVEAQSNLFSDLLCAVSTGATLVAAAGGGEISMSWGSGEFLGENTMDSVFTTPTIVYFAAAGDGPGVIWPSAAPNVVAVGGTSLSTNFTTGKFENENTWQSGGGGISQLVSRPSYQNGIASLVGTQRGTPDIAAVANPFTGVWVSDTLVYGPGTWYVVGGTSVASPTMAGIVNTAHRFSASSEVELEQLYANPSGFQDITVGNCGLYMGDFATVGWDFCSGLGAPRTYVGK